jgi:hypothetical protein
MMTRNMQFDGGSGMANDREAYVALRDSAGRYYLLPRATVEAARVADESVLRLEALLRGDAAGAGEDVSGFSIIREHPTEGSLPTQDLTSQGIIVVDSHEGLRLAGIRLVSATEG